MKYAAEPQTVLEVVNVSKQYETVSAGCEAESHSVFAVNDVSFQIPHGSFVGIMGASGSGKTTLLNLIATIDKPTNGIIRISGQNIVDIPEEDTAEFRRRHLGFIFQEYNLLETLTIYENIALALTIKEISKEKIHPMIQSLNFHMRYREDSGCAAPAPVPSWQIRTSYLRTSLPGRWIPMLPDSF